MKLHNDSSAFRVLLDAVHERTGYRTDVIEDDRIPYDLAMEALREIQQMLMNNRSWRFYRFISKQ